jgi:AcrR family transcriptional regulator
MPPPSSRRISSGTSGDIEAASRAVVDLFIQTGTSDFTVRQMAAHAGISERTFYRYFPTREDVVKPVIALGMRALVDEMQKRPSTEPLTDAIIAAFRQSWVIVPAARSQVLFKVMQETETLRAVWRQAVGEGERQWTQMIAERLDIAIDCDQAILAGAVVSTAVRLAFEATLGPHELDAIGQFSRFLNVLETGLFAQA